MGRKKVYQEPPGTVYEEKRREQDKMGRKKAYQQSLQVQYTRSRGGRRTRWAGRRPTSRAYRYSIRGGEEEDKMGRKKAYQQSLQVQYTRRRGGRRTRWSGRAYRYSIPYVLYNENNEEEEKTCGYGSRDQ